MFYLEKNSYSYGRVYSSKKKPFLDIFYHLLWNQERLGSVLSCNLSDPVHLYPEPESNLQSYDWQRCRFYHED